LHRRRVVLPHVFPALALAEEHVRLSSAQHDDDDLMTTTMRDFD
jgi:hypothetical protein